MGYAAGQSSDSFHLVRLPQTLFKLLAAFLRRAQAGAHARERSSHFADFVAARLIEGIIEIAGFQSPNAFDEPGQRPRERVGNEKDQGASGKDAQNSQSN